MTKPYWGNANAIFSADIQSPNPQSYFDDVFMRFQRIGASHVLITGIPMPGRDLSKLVLFQQWGDNPTTGTQMQLVKGSDALLRRIAVQSVPARWRTDDGQNGWLQRSPLFELLWRTAQDSQSVGVVAGMMVHHFDDMQLAICIAGASINVTDRALSEMVTDIYYEIGQVPEIRKMLGNRPGTLSNRERLVLGLTAEGKTASDIAEELDISQRTVHAHLQNASDKMHATNKTQTVVEALRYGQIQLR